MSRVLNLRYKGNNITDTEITVTCTNDRAYSGSNISCDVYFPEYWIIDIHSDVISTTFGIMVKELTYMSALKNFEEDVVDNFINDIHEIVSLRRWLWEEKMTSSLTPAEGYMSNHFEVEYEAQKYCHEEIYSHVRDILSKFIEKWSKYFDKLSINED